MFLRSRREQEKKEEQDYNPAWQRKAAAHGLALRGRWAGGRASGGRRGGGGGQTKGRRRASKPVWVGHHLEA